MKIQNLNTKDPWMLGEDIPDCDLFFSTLWLYCFANDFKKNTGRAYNKILTKFEGYHLWFYFGEKDSFEVAENIVERIVKEDDYASEINKNIIIEADKLRKYCETIPQNNLDKLSNEELWQIYKTHNEIHNHYYTWCWIPVAVDMFHNNLTRRLKDYLKDMRVSDNDLNQYFVTLTQPTSRSLIFIEQQELLKIGREIEQDKNLVGLFKNQTIDKIKHELPKSILGLLEAHRKKYYYTKHLWVEGEYVLEDYIKQLKDIFEGDQSPEEIYEKQITKLEENKQKKSKLFKELDFDKKWQNIFIAFGEFMETKIYRRYAQIFAVYQMTVILREIARRFYITEKQVRFMMKGEVEKMLLKNEYDESELLARTKMCLYYVEKDVEKIFVGDEAKNLLQQVETEIDEDVEVLQGEIGCPGQGKGKVKIIIRAEDMEKMEQGDVLVSIATDPDIVPAMKKASAIVTEQGGVTSHAAIVSRELNIPCVIGTKIATKVLRDGDMVEVDANKGIIRKI